MNSLYREIKMSSPANITITNNLNQPVKTKVTRDSWVKEDGKTINDKIIHAGEGATYKAVAKTGHSGGLDIDLVDKETNSIQGTICIKSLKDPQDSKNLTVKNLKKNISMQAKGHRHSEGDSDLRRIFVSIFENLTYGWDFIGSVKVATLLKIFGKSIAKQEGREAYETSFGSLKFRHIEIGKSDAKDSIIFEIDAQGELLEALLPETRLHKVNHRIQFGIDFDFISVLVEKYNSNDSLISLEFSESNVISGLSIIDLEKENSAEIEKISLLMLGFFREFFKGSKYVCGVIPSNALLPGNYESQIIFTKNINPLKSIVSLCLAKSEPGYGELSSDVISSMKDCDSSIILSKSVIMAAVREVLIKGLSLPSDAIVFTGGNQMIIENKGNIGLDWLDSPKITLTKLKVEMADSGEVVGEMHFKFLAPAFLFPTQHSRVDLTINPLVEDGELRLGLNFNYSEIGLDPLAEAVAIIVGRIVREKLNDISNIPIIDSPWFYAEDVIMPGFMRLSGGLHKPKE